MADEQVALRRRLREQQLALASQQASPRQVVVDLLLGRPTSLEQFKSLEQKLALLDTATALSAGPAIVKVRIGDLLGSSSLPRVRCGNYTALALRTLDCDVSLENTFGRRVFEASEQSPRCGQGEGEEGSQ